MGLITHLSIATAFLAAFGIHGTASAECSGPPAYFMGSQVQMEAEITVKAGTGCRFNLNGIPGAITEVKILQPPKVGRAGVQGLYPFYVAKPGYQGRDEFTYSFIGQDQYGGPMHVTIKRNVTVVP